MRIEFFKSRAVAMLSQTRKGKCINKKKKTCKTCYPLEVLRGKPKKLKGSIVLQERMKEHGMERALTGISLSACPVCPVLSIADQTNEGKSSIKQKKSFVRRCLS